MNNIALNLKIDFDITHCGECGGTYALNARYVRQKEEKGGYWHCPYCRTSWGYGESENDRLKAEVKRTHDRRKRAEAARERAEKLAAHEAARAAGFKGALTKTKNRIAAGVCPCCNRSFQDLRRHMESQHPDFVELESDAGDGALVCAANTATGERCERRVMFDGHRCWQHA